MNIDISPEYEDEKNTFTQTGYFCFRNNQDLTTLNDIFLNFGGKEPDC